MSFGEDLGFDQEPRKMFISFLILNLNQIFQKISARNHTLAIRPLRILIASLDRGSKKKLEQQHKQLKSFEANINLCSREKLEQIYEDTLNYLHDTYLVEARHARPKIAKIGKLGDKQP